jgi:hypothetical protein
MITRRHALATLGLLLAAPRTLWAADGRRPDGGVMGPRFIPPRELTPAMVDWLIWPEVQRINASGWIWTTESCQGHSGKSRFPHLGLASDRMNHFLEVLARVRPWPPKSDALPLYLLPSPEAQSMKLGRDTVKLVIPVSDAARQRRAREFFTALAKAIRP